MAKVIFGVWDGTVIDNRNRNVFEIDEHPAFQAFDEFNPGNPIKAFLGGHGFLIFEKGICLLDAARQYMQRVARESCGKCTPCRVGSQIIAAKLGELTNGNRDPGALEEITTIAEHIRSTSLCGLGQTATVALLEMIRHLGDELLAEINNGRKPCLSRALHMCRHRASRPVRPASMCRATSIISRTANSPTPLV